MDLGNSQVRLAQFGLASDVRGLPLLGAIQKMPADRPPAEIRWDLEAGSVESDLPWFVSSVNPASTKRWLAWLAQTGWASRVHCLSPNDFPLRLAVTQPSHLGVDRVAAATGAWAQFGHPDQAIVVVDAGTAITVDTVLGQGIFLGGAILTGPGLALKALNLMTGQLPLVHFPDNPRGIAAIGTDTQAAIQAGVYWGLIGAVRTLIEQSTNESRVNCRVILTGGAGRWMASHLLPDLGYDPDLVLRGIAYGAARLSPNG
jgi:type III pantothenate kinase